MASFADNMRGAGLMSLSMAAFTINDAAIKVVFQDVPFFQTIFVRGLFTIALMYLAAKMLRMGALHVARADRSKIMIRACTDVGATYFFLTALSNIPLANATAIIQTAPLSITLASAIFLREPVGWRRWIAIGIGFCGVMLIVQPGSDGFSAYSLYALIAVGFVTARDLLTRRISKDTTSITIAMINAIAVTIFAGLGSVSETWVMFTSQHLGYLAISVVAIVGAYWFSASVMRVGDVSFVAPFRFTALLWALILGLLLFGDWPDFLTGLGACIVVATGIFSFYRERQISRAA